MIRAALRIALCGVLAALLGPALLALFYSSSPALEVDFDRHLPPLVGGVYPPERDDSTGLTFSWTGEELLLRLPGLDRRVDWQLDMRVRAARPDPRTIPELSFFVDGVLVATRPSTQDFADLRVIAPARPERRRGAVLTMRVSNTFVPSPADPRALGVLVDRMTLSPSGLVLPPRRALAGASASAALLGVGVALVGVATSAAAMAAIVISASSAVLLARGFGPFSAYPMTAIALAFWTAVLLAGSSRLIAWRHRQPLKNTAKFALAFSAFAAFVKLMVLLHPEMPIGDALFHAHRFRLVDSGTWVFTSIAPGNYQFPYAPGLYVAALPFADAVVRNSGDMALLRIFVVAFDAGAAALLYLAVVRVWGDRLAGAVAVAVYHLVPLDFGVATVGNLTNAFAQAIAVFGLAIIASPALRLERLTTVAALTVVLSAAFMSHTSTFAVLLPTCLLIALAFLWRGGPALQSPARAVAIAALVAAALAIAVYYRHFGDVYRAEWARISAETVANVPDVGGRTAMDRFRDVPRQAGLHLGLPNLILAGIGAYRLYTRSARDRLTLAAVGWTIPCVLFLVLGILTPVDMRYYLASIPIVAITAAAGASWMWTKGRYSRAATFLLLGWTTVAGVKAILGI